jgi:hypothetical protein
MCLKFGFIIFWQKDFGAKAAHKMLVKLTFGSKIFFSQLNLSRFQTKNLAFKCRGGSVSILILTITVFTKQITNFLRTDF